MDQAQYNQELLAFEEKIALSELEVKKAEERVAELEYEKARFNMQAFIMSQKTVQEK